MTTAIIPPVTRFWPHVDQSNVAGCWIWTSALSQAGYGRFNVGHHMVMAHRFAYETVVGPVPAGLTLDHLCRVRACVNPDHLEPVTMRVNLLRGVSPAALHARKTHCPQGHAYSSENTRLHNGQRHCRACNRAYCRNRYALRGVA